MSETALRERSGVEEHSVQLRTVMPLRVMRSLLGVLMRSEKSSANTETGADGRAVPAPASDGIELDCVSAVAQDGSAFFR
jgi:hypothetical protein